MPDLDERNTRRAPELNLIHEVTTNVDGISLFATNSRTQALLDGNLVDVSEVAWQSDLFIYPVAVTRQLWEDIRSIPVAHSYETADGRLRDVLRMAHYAVYLGSDCGSEIRFNMLLHVGDATVYPVRLVCEPGDHFEPVLTLDRAEIVVHLPLGQVTITNGALAAFVKSGDSLRHLLARHRKGDWGDTDAAATAVNNQAYLEGTRILSSYALTPTEQTIWIMTEWDRSMTKIMLPCEY